MHNENHISKSKRNTSRGQAQRTLMLEKKKNRGSKRGKVPFVKMKTKNRTELAAMYKLLQDKVEG